MFAERLPRLRGYLPFVLDAIAGRKMPSFVTICTCQVVTANNTTKRPLPVDFEISIGYDLADA